MDPIMENESNSPAEIEEALRKEEKRKAKQARRKKQHSSGASETVVGERRKFVVTTIPPFDESGSSNSRANSHTIHFGVRGAEQTRPHVRSIFEENDVRRSLRKPNAAKDDSQLCSQTVHGTSVSQKTSIFDLFRLRRKSDAKKHPSIMQQVKAAISKSPHRSLEDSEFPKGAPKGDKEANKVDDKSSDKRYYHTVTGASSRRSSPITRVMDLFRSKPAAESNPNNDSQKRKHNTLSSTKRRSSLNTPNYYKSSYANLDPMQARQLFREIRGLPKYDPYLSLVNYTQQGKDRSKLVINFFKYHRCHELLPKSAKVIIFDTHFLVRKAFNTLITNGIRSAPLWDSDKKMLVGMTTVTDFIKMLQIYYKKNMSMQDFEEHTFHMWRKQLQDYVKPLIFSNPDASLYEAINILNEHHIHRIPVIDPSTGNVLYIISHKRILRFLFIYINEFPDITFIRTKVCDLNIGTFDNIETVTETNTIIEALEKLINNNISVLPIVDEFNVLKDSFAKYDVMNLVTDKIYNNLNLPLQAILDKKKEWSEPIQKCNKNISLYEALELIVRTESHRFFIVDEDEKLLGIVSLSDIIKYLITIPKSPKHDELLMAFKLEKDLLNLQLSPPKNQTINSNEGKLDCDELLVVRECSNADANINEEKQTEVTISIEDAAVDSENIGNGT